MIVQRGRGGRNTAKGSGVPRTKKNEKRGKENKEERFLYE